MSWPQKMYIHGIEVAAPVTKKSSNQAKRIIFQLLSVRQIFRLDQSLSQWDLLTKADIDIDNRTGRIYS